MRHIQPLLFACALTIGALSQTVAPDTHSTQATSSPQFGHARQLLQQGRYDEAIAELQQLASSQPGTKGLAHELGTAYYRKGDYVHAIESLKQALQADPADNEATQLIGLSYYLSGKPADAIPYLEKVQTWYS